MANVLLEWHGPVGVLTINRPAQLNALNTETIGEIDKAVDEVIANKACRALVLTGAGEKAFVAGADVREMEAMTAEDAARFSKESNDIFLKLERLSVPVIGAINGFALGGGCELAMTCDIRLAAQEAVFGMPETSLGIFPGFGGTQRLARIVGYAKAAQLIFTCKKLKAQEALEIGLVNEIFPKEELLDAAMAMANTIAKQAPLAVSRVKQVMQAGMDLPLQAGLDLESQVFGTLFDTEDAKGGLKAFGQKEKYEYAGK